MPFTSHVGLDQSRSIVLEDFPENEFTELRYGLEYNFWKLYARAEQGRDRYGESLVLLGLGSARDAGPVVVRDVG